MIYENQRQLLEIFIIGLSMLTSYVRANPQEKLPFSFSKKPLRELLEQKVPAGNSLILPQRAHDLEVLTNQQVTYLPHDPLITQQSAWSLLKTFLELSGFSINKRNNTFVVVRNESIRGGAIEREPLPLYVGVLPETQLPDDTYIRYIHYLQNFPVPKASEKDSHYLTKMIQSFLSFNSSLLFDPASNSIIITDKASHVIALAHTLQEFEARGLKEQVSSVPLRFVSAHDVATILNTLKMAAEPQEGDQRSFIRSDPQSDAITAITQDTRIVADPLRNSVVLLGRPANVDRISEFIRESLDKPADAGSSILHVYDCQYIDAAKCVPVLTHVLTSRLSSETQATEESEQKLFQGVTIVAEEPREKVIPTTTEEVVLEFKGSDEVIGLVEVPPNAGNRLIIAARIKDWLLIKKLLEQLDQPQPQVLLEVLVAEFSYDHRTRVAGTNRSKTDTDLLPDGVQYLASHISPVSNVLGTNPTQLAQDLLQVIGTESVTSQTAPGSLLLSLNDPKTPGIFGLLEILDQVLTAKVNAYPHITISNNQQGSIDTTETRRGTGDMVTTTSGTFTIPLEDITATINVTTVPHIISQNRLRLTIGFTVEEFLGSTTTRMSRELKTTATLSSGEILAMGGLLRVDVRDRETFTPLIGYVPLIGTFFRQTDVQTIRKNLTLFVMPTIIDIRLRTQWSKKTEEFLCEHFRTSEAPQHPSDDQDPLRRLFFDQQTHRSSDMLKDAPNITVVDLQSCDEPKLLRKPKKEEKLPVFCPHKLKRVLAVAQQPLLRKQFIKSDRLLA